MYNYRVAGIFRFSPSSTQTRVELAVGECKLYKEERNVLEEEMREADGCDKEKYILLFGTIDGVEKTIYFPGDRR